MKNPQPLFKPSAATISVTKLMVECAIGEIVTYEDMRKEIRGEIPHERLLGSIQSARRALLRERRMVFSSVPTVGCQRLSADDTVRANDQDIRRVKRGAQMAMAKLSTADEEDLSPEMRGKKATRMVALAVIAGCFDTRQRKALTDQGALPGKPSQLSDILRGGG